MSTVEMRFRMVEGVDIGPLTLSTSTTVSAVKNLVLAEWPERDGIHFKTEPPEDSRFIRLILNGRVLGENRTLAECGVPQGMLVTCHLVVRPKIESASGKHGAGGGKGGAPAPGGAGSGCCVIS
mmetsp:Transcript_9751/g.35462  ORF Transcript_9751/g.35462 Transcript_9751/m.35462 type:complete len:124 (-) Transcript_9751:66-437(-)